MSPMATLSCWATIFCDNELLSPRRKIGGPDILPLNNEEDLKEREREREREREKESYY